MLRIIVYFLFFQFSLSLQAQIVLGHQNTPYPESEYIYKKISNSFHPAQLLDSNHNWNIQNAAITGIRKVKYFTRDTSYNPFGTLTNHMHADPLPPYHPQMRRSDDFFFKIDSSGMYIIYGIIIGPGIRHTKYFRIPHIPFPTRLDSAYTIGFGLYRQCNTSWGVNSVNRYWITASKEDTLSTGNHSDLALMLSRINTCYSSGSIHGYSGEELEIYEWYYQNSEMPELILEISNSVSVYHGYRTLVTDSTVWLLDSIIKRSLITGVESLNEDPLSELRIFPNPVESKIQIQLKNKVTNQIDYRIFDLNSKLLLEGNFLGNQTKEINVGLLPKGLYFLHFKDQKGNRHIEKFIKN